MTEPLPPELADLVAAERAAPGADIAARASVRSAIAAKVGTAPLGASAGGLGALGKTLAILAVTIGAGTAAVVYRGTSDAGAHVAAPRVEHATDVHAPPPLALVDTPAPPNAPAPSTAAAGASSAEHTQASEPAPSNRHASEPAPSDRHASEPAPSDHHASEPAESERHAAEAAPSEPRGSDPVSTAPLQADLLRRATAALVAGNSATALELTQRDRELHRDGMLAEERDALEIRALARLGRDTDAHAAAVQFFTRYPASVHRAVLERALRPQPRTHGEP